MPKSAASAPAGPVPICFLLDDTAPINPMTHLYPEQPHKLVIPNALWEELGDFCAEHDVRGKTSVLPNPSGFGRIDQGLGVLPDGHLEGFLHAMHNLARQLDLTPELVTHEMVVDPATGRKLHWFEDQWVARQDRETLADYLAYALRILKNAGLRANGMTSPWSTGIEIEPVYAAAISDALWRVNRVRHGWYFLHVDEQTPRLTPQVTYRDAEHGRTVVSLPSGTTDFVWYTQYAPTRREGLAVAREAMEAMLNRDGTRGRLVELFQSGGPIIFHSHAQSLFSNGTQAGLQGLRELVLRIEAVFGDRVRWMRCSELAARACGQDPL